MTDEEEIPPITLKKLNCFTRSSIYVEEASSRVVLTGQVMIEIRFSP